MVTISPMKMVVWGMDSGNNPSKSSSKSSKSEYREDHQWQ
jgi:hypothetical protein